MVKTLPLLYKVVNAIKRTFRYNRTVHEICLVITATHIKPPRRTKKTMPQTVPCGYTIILLDYKIILIQNVVLLCFIQNLKIAIH